MIVCFGEPLIRLSSPFNRRWNQAQSCDLDFGGAECNVAVALSRWDSSSRFVGKVPQNALGDAFEEALRGQGVDGRYLQKGGPRLGLYWLERGAGLRASQVIYDRAGSSFSQIESNDWDWMQVLADAKWLHFSGITPALGANVLQVLAQALQAARELEVAVSCDVNYRAKLWSVEEASQTLTPLLRGINLVISNEEHARLLFDATGQNDGEIARSLSQQLAVSSVALTRRSGVSGERNGFGATLWHQNQIWTSRQWEFAITDRVGSGDAFAAGILRALSANLEMQSALEFAVAACVLKHSIAGDWCMSSVGEIEQFARGDGRVSR